MATSERSILPIRIFRAQFRPPQGSAAPVTTQRRREAMKRFRRSQRLRILVVQARPDSREMLRRLLCAATYEVHTAESYAQGRLVASSLEQGPDVVVADVRLPDGDGVDLMSELHALHGCRTIALAARLTHDRDARRCRE